MILDILLFVVGIVLIVVGANILTDGAATLAQRMGISPLVVGLTIVAFGTSAPELVVSLTSALKGNSDIALGNVVGSNIFNTLAILGVTALVCPLAITKTTIRREVPLMMLASAVVSVLSLDSFWSGIGGARDILSRGEGIALLGFFLIFLTYTFGIAKSEDIPVESGEEEATPTGRQRPIWLLLLMIAGGLVGLVWGGDLFVDAASSIARQFGVSDAFIGLTIVAIGTSLPELATSVVAAIKKQPEIAVGNVVGSNIFNIFFILGTTATVTPVGAGGVGSLDYGVMFASSVLLYVFGVFFGNRVVTRCEGGVLLLCFIAYTTYLLSTF